MGLGTVNDGGNATYLTIAGGYIWNRRADKSDPNYATQEWTDNKGEVRERVGAQYGDLTGLITSAWTKTHEQFGEALYIKLHSDGEDYILNIKTNTANSQQMMKAMLLMDLDKEIFIKPYDFTDKEKSKRVQGISFKQNGEKIDLREYNPGDEWKTEKDFWLPSNKKKYSRWLEDFSDFLVGEIEEKIVPELDSRNPKEDDGDNTPAPKKKEVKKQPVEKKAEVETPKETETPNETASVTPLRMKKFLKEYIEENYEGESLPKLTKEEVITWYNLAQSLEELPFEKQGEESDEAEEADEDDIQAQLDALAGN